MKKNRIICLLLVMLLILPIAACNLVGVDINKGIDNNEKGAETVNGQKTPPQEKAEKPEEKGKGTEIPSQEKKTEMPSGAELVDFIHSAETTLLTVCSEGFEAEFHGIGKKEFKQISENLLKYYTESYLYPTWKDFYENHLGEWGYGMGELFIFADHNTAKDSFVGTSNEKGQIKVHFNYNVGADEYYGPESEILEYTYVLIQTDGKWLINEILYEQ